MLPTAEIATREGTSLIHPDLTDIVSNLLHSNLVEIVDNLDEFGVGSGELRHFFEHPHCGRGSVSYRQRLPLRHDVITKDRNSFHNPEALGVLLFDDLSNVAIMVLCSVYFAATLAFGIVWWVVKGDMQGAFGAAAYFATFSGLISLSVTAVLSSRE